MSRPSERYGCHVSDASIQLSIWFATIFLFQLWRTDEALPDDELTEDGFDALPAGNELDLAQLIEDEVLLGLPLSPRHADCQVPHSATVAANVSSFDVLKKLKRPH